MSHEVSLDNLTLIGYDRGDLFNLLSDNPFIKGTGFSRNYGFDKTVFFQDNSFMEYSNHERKVRLEFNPNKASMKEIKKIISRLKYPRLTRMDIAIDYYNEDLAKYDWKSDRRKKKTTITGTNDELETLYIGAQSSETRYRIYNKKLERKEVAESEVKHEHWWRVELQKRFKADDTAFYEVEDYFKKDFFNITPESKEYDLSVIEKATDKAMILGIMQEPSIMKEFSKNTRLKYTKMLKEVKKKAPLLDPKELFEEEKEKLALQLKNLFKLAEQNNVIK